MSDTTDGPATRREFLAAMAGSTVAAGAGVGTASAAGGESGGGSGGSKTHTVGMSGTAFSPDSLEVAPGDTVVWEGNGGTHTVTAYEDEIPDGATYFASGGFDSEQAARDGWSGGGEGGIAEGGTYEHTFETTGTFGYFCIPHESMGMTGTVTVTDNPSSGGGGQSSVLPDTARTIGVTSIGAMVSVLGLAYVFMKYGHDYAVEE